MEARNAPTPFTHYKVRRSSKCVPELPHGCNSWVVTSPTGVVRELYERANVQLAIAHGWKAETTVDYLARLNAEIRAAGAVS